MRNQRQYYRIDDQVEFYYSPVLSDAQSTLPTPEAQIFTKDDHKYFQAIKKTQMINREILQQVTEISKKSPLIAKCLKLLNERTTISLKSILSTDSRQMMQVNLSIGGVGFSSHSPLELGTLLHTKLILHPALIALDLSARVVFCKPTRLEELPYRISTKFLDTTEEDKDLLSYHINDAQRRQLQKIKQAEEALDE